MIATRPSEAPERRQEIPRRSLFVPIDASPASGRAVALALRLAKRSPAQIALMALLDTEGEAGDAAALHRQIQEAGVPGSLHVLDGEEPAARLRQFIDAAPSSGLILSNPGSLDGALRRLTVDLLVRPPCTVYLTASPARPGGERGLVMRALLKSLWQRLPC